MSIPQPFREVEPTKAFEKAWGRRCISSAAQSHPKDHEGPDRTHRSQPSPKPEEDLTTHTGTAKTMTAVCEQMARHVVSVHASSQHEEKHVVGRGVHQEPAFERYTDAREMTPPISHTGESLDEHVCVVSDPGTHASLL